MTEEEVLAEFRAAGALMEGHFILSSGLHSPLYLQCARVLMNPLRAARIASALAARIPEDLRSRIEIVVSPAMGGLIIGHEMARALGVREAGGEVIAAAALVDRASGTTPRDWIPFFALLRLDAPAYAADALPPELAAIPPEKPGSRKAA